MRIEIPAGNWHIALIDAIENSEDYDIIAVKNQAMKNLAEDAKLSICPDKKISFDIDYDDEDDLPEWMRSNL